MSLDRLSNGERIAGISAILLFAFMFFHWFGFEASNDTNLLVYFRSVLPGKSAWAALDYIPFVLLATTVATLSIAALRLTPGAELPVAVNAVVASLGVVSVLLILLRVLYPPSFDAGGALTYQGTVQFPIFLALAAAAGIAFGGCLAMWEEGVVRAARASTPLGQGKPRRSVQ